MPTTTPHQCPPAHAHDETCYQRHACRCTPCRAAHAASMSARRRQQAYGTYTRALIDATPTRAHLAWLRSQGMGVKTIAAASGVPKDTLGRVMWGRRDHATGTVILPPKVAPKTAERILAVRPELHLLADHAVIDATGYRRRVQALVAHGWSLPAIARAVDGQITEYQLRGWVHGDRITAASARDVVALFDRLWMLTPPADTPQQAAMVARARRLAGRYGWVPALAWDDIDTDPAPPADVEDAGDGLDEIAIELAIAGRAVRLTPGERRVCVRRLHAKRWSDQAIATRLGCADKTVYRIRDELNLPAWPLGELEAMGNAA